jgi:hypothetical protein
MRDILINVSFANISVSVRKRGRQKEVEELQEKVYIKMRRTERKQCVLRCTEPGAIMWVFELIQHQK